MFASVFCLPFLVLKEVEIFPFLLFHSNESYLIVENVLTLQKL